MGYLLHHKFVVQDLLQIEFNQSVEKYPQSDPGISGRYANPRCLSHVSPGDLQILCWSHLFLGGKLRGGMSPSHHPMAIPRLISLPFSPKRISPKPGTSVTRMRHAIKSQFDTASRLFQFIPSHHPSRATTTDHSQTHTDLSNSLPPSHNTYPTHPCPSVALPTAPRSLSTSIALHQERRSSRLRCRACSRRRRVRQTPHLPDARTRSRHRTAQSSPKGLHCRWIRRSQGYQHATSAENSN